MSDKVFKHWRLLGTETVYDVTKEVFRDMCDGDSGEHCPFHGMCNVLSRRASDVF